MLEANVRRTTQHSRGSEHAAASINGQALKNTVETQYSNMQYSTVQHYSNSRSSCVVAYSNKVHTHYSNIQSMHITCHVPLPAGEQII